MSDPIVFAYAEARTLLEAIPWYERVECDIGVIGVAWAREMLRASGTFPVRGLPFPATSFSDVHAILSRMVRERDGKPSLIDFRQWLEDHRVTNVRIVGHRRDETWLEFSRSGGVRWGRMSLTAQPPAQQAPTLPPEEVPA